MKHFIKEYFYYYDEDYIRLLKIILQLSDIEVKKLYYLVKEEYDWRFNYVRRSSNSNDSTN